MGRENIAEIGEFHIPKFVVNTLALVGIIDKAVYSLFSFIHGLFYYFELEPSSDIEENQPPGSSEPPLSVVLIREFLPAVKFSDVACSTDQPTPECAVCLDEFDGDEEIRCLKNCEHYFHRGCIDRWMDEDRNTCPLCRKSLVPVDSRKEYDNRLLRADFFFDEFQP